MQLRNISRIALATAAVATLTVASTASAQSGSVDIDLSGFESFGDFLNPLNTSTLVDIEDEAVQIVGAEFIDLMFTTENGSFPSELVLSVNQTANTGAAGTFWDSTVTDITGGDQTVGPISGPFENPGEFGSGPFPTLADGDVFVYVYETFDDPFGGTAAAERDALISQGTLRLTYGPIPEPASLGLLGAAGLGLMRRRRA